MTEEAFSVLSNTSLKNTISGFIILIGDKFLWALFTETTLSFNFTTTIGYLGISFDGIKNSLFTP